MPHTAQEQLVLEMINRARLDPAGEAARLGLALNEGLAAGTISATSKQPLAGNAQLLAAARGHSQHMLNVDRFGHSGIGDGTPTSRMTAAGYVFTGAWTNAENIGFNGTTGPLNQTAFAIKTQNDLFIDEGYAGRGHRLNMLDGDFREVGIAHVPGVYTSNGVGYNSGMMTQNFATTGTNVFVTGVAINDANGNNFYDVGEGRGSISVRVSSGGVLLGQDVTEAAGGYGASVAPRAAPVTVSFSGTPLPHAVTVTLANLTQNAKVDLLGTNEILSSASTVMGSGAVILGLLGTLNLTASGNSAHNMITGNKGGNLINGGAGNDTISGGLGNDVLIGASGRDVLTGGAHNDVFRFLSAADSGNTAATRDIITDFRKIAATGVDRIDVSAIDARLGSGTANDTFAFLAAKGAVFSAAGQLRWYHEDLAGTANDKTIIAANLDANLATSEFQIELRGLVSLTGQDFVL